jgi:hypothetical protein
LVIRQLLRWNKKEEDARGLFLSKGKFGMVEQSSTVLLRFKEYVMIYLSVTIATVAAQRGSGRSGPSRGLLDMEHRSWTEPRLIGPYLGQLAQNLGTIG